MEITALTIQLLNWVAERDRTYAGAMDAWRTSCPRLTTWEDALIGGLIEVEGQTTKDQARVVLTEGGRAALEESRPRF